MAFLTAAHNAYNVNHLVETELCWKERPGFWCKFWQNHFSTVGSVPCTTHPPSALPSFFFLLKGIQWQLLIGDLLDPGDTKLQKDTPVLWMLLVFLKNQEVWCCDLSDFQDFLGLLIPNMIFKKDLSCKQHFSCKQNTVFQYSILPLCWKTWRRQWALGDTNSVL